MVRIKITPEQVRRMGHQFRQASRESQDLVRRLQTSLTEASADWAGMTKERFYNEFQEWQQAMHDFVELLDSIGGQLEAIAERFEAADRGA